ncbi:MAG: hypothetical protein SGARI_005608 [Bacillariaceae sp.]
MKIQQGRFLISVLLLFLPLFFNREAANTGGGAAPRNDDLEAVSEEDMRRYMMKAASLQAASPNIPSQDAVDLAALLDGVSQDPETRMMVEKLKGNGGKQAGMDAFSGSMTQTEIVDTLKKTMDELKALEYLFQDPARAVKEMEKDGMIPKKQVKFYRENPEQLAEDTRKGLYFSLVSLAAAGEFL